MHARTLPAPPRSPGLIRRLLTPWVAADVFDFWASYINRNWTWERRRARLLMREQAAEGAVTLWLKPNRHWGGFLPGQHINLGVEIDGVRHTRSYSLTQPPRADGLLSITIKAVQNGRVSAYLSTQARAGEVFDIGPAYGDLCLPDVPDGSYLFLAAGSGITPLMALIRQWAAQGMPVPVDLVYWVRTRQQACFLGELRTLAARHPHFRLHLALTGQAAHDADERTGRVQAGWLDTHIPALAERHVMACGPGGFAHTVRDLLMGRVRSFQCEAFSPPAGGESTPAMQDSGQVEVLLKRSGRRLRIARGQPLLTALEAAGLTPAFGCRMGICNTCTCAKGAGSTRHLPSGTVAHDPTQALKLCIHSAVTDLDLDL